VALAATISLDIQYIFAYCVGWFNRLIPPRPANLCPYKGSDNLLTAKMQKLPPESWCDHEFVVLRKKDTTTDKHVIAIFDGEDALTEEVFCADGKLVRKAVKINDCKEEEEYNKLGNVSLTRVWSQDKDGIIVCDERSTGSSRCENLRTFNNDGRALSLIEKTFYGAVVQSESVTRYNADGSPAGTVTNTYDQNGRVRKIETVHWFKAGRPAITETTECSAAGMITLFTKVMHNTAGAPLWQEKTYYAENSPKPSKKELTVFSAKSSNAFVDVSELREDGSVAKHVLSMLVDASKAPEEKKLTTADSRHPV
jgi:hypothetical protein